MYREDFYWVHDIEHERDIQKYHKGYGMFPLRRHKRMWYHVRIGWLKIRLVRSTYILVAFVSKEIFTTSDLSITSQRMSIKWSKWRGGRGHLKHVPTNIAREGTLPGPYWGITLSIAWNKNPLNNGGWYWVYFFELTNGSFSIDTEFGNIVDDTCKLKDNDYENKKSPYFKIKNYYLILQWSHLPLTPW